MTGTTAPSSSSQPPTNYKFSEIIAEIDRELHPKYQGGCYAYIDKHFDEAWSKAVGRFEDALNTKNQSLIRLEAQVYRDAMMRFIELYRQEKNKSGIDALIASIEQQRGTT